MGALHSLFDPAVHAFCGTANGHDAMALQVQVMVALRMLSAAEKKVGKEGRRREKKWGAKTVAREEGWKGEILRVSTPTFLPSCERSRALERVSEAKWIRSRLRTLRRTDALLTPKICSGFDCRQWWRVGDAAA